jgi:peptidoglycan glycosyltransferase
MARFFSSYRFALGCAAVGALAGSVAAESGLAADSGDTLRASATPAVTARLTRTSRATARAARRWREVEKAPGSESWMVGDSALRGELDLDRAVLRKGRYLVPIDEKRTAILTLDPKLQQTAEHVLAQARAPLGAVVVMTVDGRVLALAGRRNRAPVKQRDFALPLSVWAPAASIFKIVTAAALVDAGVDPDARVCYHGGRRSIDASNLEDHPKRDRNCADLAHGIAKSQNALIAKLSHRHLSPAGLRSFARIFGFETAPDFALEVEPSRADIPEEPLSFARVSAGFWKTELSPIGGALVANLIAARGVSVTPRIVDSVVEPGGRVQPIASVEPHRVLSEELAASVATMMMGTTEVGTAYKGFHDRGGRRYFPDMAVAGKTGTLSQVSSGDSDEYTQYSWFVGFAPADDPEITISVLLGNPRKWHLKAHTAARIVLQDAL